MDNEITLKYFVYVRRSSEDNKDRQNASIPEQLEALEKITIKDKLIIVNIFEESQTAFKPGRPIFNEMLDRIKKGEANSILIWHENRLARNPVDSGLVVYSMDQGYLVEVVTPSRIYKNTPSDKFLLALELAKSKQDSDDKSIAVTRGLNGKCRNGWRPGVPPLGYLPDKFTASGLRKIYKDNDRFPFIKKIFELFINGTSVKEIHHLAKNDWHLCTRQRKRIGGKPLSVSMIYAILNNPFYFGRFEYPVGSGNWYKGEYEKAINEEIFNKVQIKLGKRSQYKLKHRDYAYSGSLIKCGYCNSAIVEEEKNQVICSNCKYKFSITKNNKDKCTRCNTRIEDMKNPVILHYVYCRCGRKKKINAPCKQRGVEVHELEKQIDEKLSQIEISPLFLDWAIRQIQKMNDNDKTFRETTIEATKRAYDRCRTELDNLLRLKISPENKDGSMLSDERYKTENTKLENELKTIENQLANTNKSMLQANQDVVNAFNFATRVRERFAKGDSKTKREIFLGLGSHFTLFDKKVDMDSPEYLFTLKKMKQEVPSIGKMVAPEEQSVLVTEMEASWASIPTLLRGQESHLA